MGIKSRFTELPKKTKNLLIVGVLLALVVALPLFIWGITSQKFLIFKKAASGEPAVTYGRPIHWSTASVKLDASDFWITVNGNKFMGNPSVNVHSDPGSSTYTTLEATWQENGVEMRLFLYFDADGQNWWLREARIYNGLENGDWIYLITNGQVYKSPLGTPFEEGLMTGLVKNDNSGQTVAEVQFQNLTLQAFANRTAGGGTIPCSYAQPELSLYNAQSFNPAPGASFTYTFIVKNKNSGLCENPYTNMTVSYWLPGVGWDFYSSRPLDIYSAAGDTTAFNVTFFTPPNSQVNTWFYPLLHVYNPDLSATTEIQAPVYVQYYGSPTPMATASAIPTASPQACALDAMICPDGSSVGRVPPNCNFAPCPATTASPTPTPYPSRSFGIQFKFDGVTDGSAEGAGVTARFVGPAISNPLGRVTPPITSRYIANGIYQLRFSLPSFMLPPGNYAIILKGEKHAQEKFCSAQGQTEYCTAGTLGQIYIPDTTNLLSLNFNGIPLPAGDTINPDTHLQDSQVNDVDYQRIFKVLSKPYASQTDEDLLVGDLNYSGRVDGFDMFLLMKTLSVRHDEY